MELVLCSRLPVRARIGLCLGIVISLSACGKANPPGAGVPIEVAGEANGLNLETQGGSPTLVAALWEKANPETGQAWTQHALQVITSDAPSLLAGTKDITQFCSNYFSLNINQKASFWVYLISAVTSFESGFNPTSRMREPALGTDHVTHLPVYSEGLLQLSYQDALIYPACNEFNWNADKQLAPRDPRKSILDPYKNISCGIRILNRLVERKNLIAFKSGQYWSTLMPGGPHGVVPDIQALTRKILFCRK